MQAGEELGQQCWEGMTSSRLDAGMQGKTWEWTASSQQWRVRLSCLGACNGCAPAGNPKRVKMA